MSHADHPLVSRLRDASQAWLAYDHLHGPTNQLTGGGAIATLEQLISQLHGDRPALLMPSGTYALRVALTVSGVAPSDEVLVPGVDGPSTWAAVESLGARPVPVTVDLETLTIDPRAAVAARSRQTKAVIACHLHGVPADVPGLRGALPGLPIIEDCRQGLGSTLDGLAVGTLGDTAVLSFGPAKPVDAGEGGALLLRDLTTFRAAVRAAAHPVRQALAGVLEPEELTFSIRPHPVAAILGWHALQTWNSEARRAAGHRFADQLAALRGFRVVGADPRRSNAGPGTPVVLARDRTPRLDGVVLTRTPARVLGAARRRLLAELLSRTYVARLLDRDVCAA